MATNNTVANRLRILTEKANNKAAEQAAKEEMAAKRATTAASWAAKIQAAKFAAALPKIMAVAIDLATAQIIAAAEQAAEKGKKNLSLYERTDMGQTHPSHVVYHHSCVSYWYSNKNIHYYSVVSTNPPGPAPDRVEYSQREELTPQQEEIFSSLTSRFAGFDEEIQLLIGSKEFNKKLKKALEKESLVVQDTDGYLSKVSW